MTTTADQPVPANGKRVLGVLRQCPNCGAQIVDPKPYRDITCLMCGGKIKRPK